MSSTESHVGFGFEYLVEVVRDGKIVDREVVHNLVPTEGMNHILNTVLKAGTQVPTWYVGLFQGDYIPETSDTMSTLPTEAVEATQYSGAVRPSFTPGAVTGGAVNNSAAQTVFTFTGAATVYGGFISSSNVKGGTSGVLLSVVRFATPKVLDADAELRVTAGLTLAST